jgi:hypothetical protein
MVVRRGCGLRSGNRMNQCRREVKDRQSIQDRDRHALAATFFVAHRKFDLYLRCLNAQNWAFDRRGGHIGFLIGG